jgi:Rod binding domain-containing protein
MLAPIGEVWAERLARLRESGRSEDPELLKQAAADFEALLVAEMLKSARSSGGGWLGSGEDEAGATMVELAEQQFAQALAAAGGLGLADLIVKGLRGTA